MATSAFAFSLIGPFKDGANGVTEGWHSPGFGGMPGGLGYSLQFDVGGPMFPTEAYRWNVPVITYAYDESFIRYFGSNGVYAVDRAFQILNELPAASQMTADLSEFPYDSRGVNNTAQALGMNDIKSQVLAVMTEQMGLANAERFVWGLRGRIVIGGTPFYSVVRMNYDPVTLAPSAYVNGVLYAYRVEEPLGVPIFPPWASAVEIADPDPLTRKYTSVSASFNNPDDALVEVGSSIFSTDPSLSSGHFLRGLTRDDAGGLRFLLTPANIAVESLLTNVNLFTNTSPWTVVVGTNTTVPTNIFNIPGISTGTNATNNIRAGLRGGVDKITFQRVNFDSLLGPGFFAMTNRYDDIVTTNGVRYRRKVERVLTAPDFVLVAEDLGLIQGVPNTFRRTGTAGWVNNNLLNGRGTQNGPGLISPPIQLSFTDNAPFYTQSGVDAIGSEQDVPFVWATFDGSTNAPIIYPAFLNYTAEQISEQVFGPSPEFP